MSHPVPTPKPEVAGHYQSPIQMHFQSNTILSHHGRVSNGDPKWGISPYTTPTANNFNGTHMSTLPYTPLTRSHWFHIQQLHDGIEH